MAPFQVRTRLLDVGWMKGARFAGVQRIRRNFAQYNPPYGQAEEPDPLYFQMILRLGRHAIRSALHVALVLSKRMTARPQALFQHFRKTSARSRR